MTQQYVPNIGSDPDATSRCDCVHFAVAPVRAMEPLEPGEHVSVIQDEDGGHWVGKEGELHGVVDPIRRTTVETGKWCWILLYPGSVTGMRHVFTHPAFTMRMPARREKV